MKTLIKLIAICITFLMLPSAYAESPAGFWKTIDDVSGKPRAILRITESENKTITGQIVRTFSNPGEIQSDICKACTGARHNQRIIGLTIMENLKPSKNTANEWDGGQILDPKTGKVYHCKLQIVENGQKLKVRGYIGLPLFGRSQTWLRVASPE